MPVTVQELLKAAQLLKYELTYVRQYVTNWAPEVARDLWPDNQESPREKRSHEMLDPAEMSIITGRGAARPAPAQPAPTPPPAAQRVTSQPAAAKEEKEEAKA
jgi:hypothetical protein